MAGSSRIKGITIEIDGETSGLQKALSNVTKESISIQQELKDVERLLKFDPGNVEALAQKQQLLSRQIENTSNKLDQLKNAQEQVDRQFANGEINENQYRAFRREIQFTERELNNLRDALNHVDDGDSLNNLREDAENAQESVKDLGGELTNLAAGAAAGMGIGKIIEKSLDVSSLNTKIDVSFNVPEESRQSVKDAINTVKNYGVDAEAALEGVRRQWALNKDASDESNAAVVQGAATITAAYSDIDFTELIQETNELSKTLGISNEDALALTYSLLKMGFPPDQLDIITEYGSQLHNVGYNAQEIQAIMAAGVETGTWNIDVLLDGLKEGRIVLAEFGQGVDEATAGLFENIGVSGEQLQAWGKAVAEGGEGGKVAMQEVTQALANVEDKTLQNQLGVKVFGTLYEENGTKILDTILGMNDNLTTAADNQNELNEATQNLNSDPMIQMQTAISNLMTALAPLLTVIANVIGKIAEWVANNPKLAATITAIVATLGILIGIVAGLAPIITMITTAIPLLTGGLAAIATPVLIVIGVITALVAAGVALYANWDWIKLKAVEVWSAISTGISSFVDSVINFFTVTIPEALSSLGTFFSSLWATIGQAFTDGWNAIVTFFTESIPAWIESVGVWFLELPNKIAYALGEALGAVIKWGAAVLSWIVTEVPKFIENIVKFHAELPGKIWTFLVAVVTKLGEWGSNVISWISTNVSTWINNIVTFFSQLPGKIWTWLVNVVTNIKTWGTNMLTEAKNGMKNVFDGIVNTFVNLPSKMLEIGKNIVAGIKNGIKAAWDGMVGWIGGLCDNFVDGVKSALDIHSPSRVMEELGKFTGEGFKIGMESTVNSISKQADELANAAIPSVQQGQYSTSLNGFNANNLDGTNGSTLEKLLAKIDSLENAISNMGIYMDSTKVGKIITPAINNNLAFNNSRKGW